MCDLVEELKKSRAGQPEIMGEVPSAMEVMSWKWDCDPELWQFVDFKAVYSYLRGSKSLAIPNEWRPLIPDQL